MWGISTVGRTSLQLFSPVGGSRRKAVSVRSAQNLTRKFGALAQLVARDIRIVEVRSSNLLCSTIYDEIRTLLHLRKRDVRMHLPKRRWAKRSSVKTPGLFVFHPEEKCKVVHIKGEILGYPDFTFIFVCASAKKPWRIFLLPIYSRAHARGALSQLKDEWNP